MRVTLLALLLLFCAHAAAAQQTADFSWSTSVIHRIGGAAPGHLADASASVSGGAFDALPPGSSVAVRLQPRMDDLIQSAADAHVHVIAEVDPASAPIESAANALSLGLAGFIVDGGALQVATFREKIAPLIEPGMPLRIASNAEGGSVIVEPPGEVIQPNTDWDAIFAGADRGKITRVRVDEWSAEIVRNLLLMPGGLYIDGSLGPISRMIEAFRLRHPAMGAGSHEQLINSVYTFQRSIDGIDAVVVVLGAEGQTAINVSRVFADDTLLQDAISGNTAFVSFGMATFEADPSGIILVEEMP